MNKVYKLKYRRGDFGIWHTIKVIGHQYETDSNKLICYLPDGGLREIAHWSDCEIILGADWQSLITDNSGNTDFIKQKEDNNTNAVFYRILYIGTPHSYRPRPGFT